MEVACSCSKAQHHAFYIRLQAGEPTRLAFEQLRGVIDWSLYVYSTLAKDGQPSRRCIRIRALINARRRCSVTPLRLGSYRFIGHGMCQLIVTSRQARLHLRPGPPRTSLPLSLSFPCTPTHSLTHSLMSRDKFFYNSSFTPSYCSCTIARCYTMHLGSRP